MQRTRVVGVCIALTVNAPVIAVLDRTSSPARQAAAWLALVLLAANVVVTFHRRAVWALDWLLVAVGIAVVGIGLSDPFAVTPLCYAMLISQSQYGSGRQTVARLTAIVVGFPAVAALNPESLHRNVRWDSGPVLSLLPFFVAVCWMVRTLHRTLVEQEVILVREAAVARLGRQLTRSTDTIEVRGLAADCAAQLCGQVPDGALLVLRQAGERWVLDTAVDSRGSATSTQDGARVPHQLAEALARGASSDQAVAIDAATARQLDGIRPTVGGRQWRTSSVTGSWGTLVVLVGARRPVTDQLLDAFRVLVTQRSLAESNLEAHRELNYRAHTDQLTTLPNRALFWQELSAAVAAAVGLEERLALLLIDLDDFKHVNDTYGHAAGDELLIQVAARIGEIGARIGVPGRFGGDEFGLILSDIAQSEADDVAARLSRAMRDPVQLDAATVRIGASIGIVAGAAGHSASDLMRCADIAMYGAKALGKNRVLRYDEELHGEVAELRAIEEQLARAVDRDEIVVSYRPIIDPRTGRCPAVEAITHWLRPGRDVISEPSLLPMAERTGELLRIGEHTLRIACRQLTAWTDEHRADKYRNGDQEPPLRMTVKISTQQLASPGFLDLVSEVLVHSQLAADRLTLELLDSSRLTDDLARDTVRGLAAHGVRIAVNLDAEAVPVDHLQQLPIHQLNLDSGALLDPERGVTFEIGATIGRMLGLQTLAKSVQSAAQETSLRAAGVTFGQGPLYAESLAAEDVRGWIHRLAGAQYQPD